jgi:hypothetical protein
MARWTMSEGAPVTDEQPEAVTGRTRPVDVRGLPQP